MDARKLIKLKLQKAVKVVLPGYVHHKNYIGKGNHEFTFLRHPVQMALLFKIAYDHVPMWVTVALVFFYLFCCWSFGWLWDRNRGYDIETEWGNKRNPTIQHIKRKV